MTRAFDVRHGTVEDILATVDFQTTAKYARRRTILAWFTQMDAQGHNLMWPKLAFHTTC